jgi:peroxiredoxin
VIEAGQPAPDFTLPDQDGQPVALADLRGKAVVLAFYPNDFSPVCTDQLSVYQEALGEFESRGVRVLGISVDSAFCHKAFRRHLNLTIPLLADFHPKGEVARAYGVWAEAYGVAGRSLVIVGPDGIVEWTYRSPPLEVPEAALILDALDQRSFRNSGV